VPNCGTAEPARDIPKGVGEIPRSEERETLEREAPELVEDFCDHQGDAHDRELADEHVSRGNQMNQGEHCPLLMARAGSDHRCDTASGATVRVSLGAQNRRVKVAMTFAGTRVVRHNEVRRKT
jgi:hypothetical protein